MENAVRDVERILVDRQTFETFNRLFTTEQRHKGPISWKMFVKAMTRIGFQYHPKSGGGSGRVFEPRGYPSRARFFWDEPHSRKQGGRGKLSPGTQGGLAGRLSEVYGWTNETFGCAH